MIQALQSPMTLQPVPRFATVTVPRRRYCPSCGCGRVVLVSRMATRDDDLPSADTWECRDCRTAWQTDVSH